ncbi:hypothetical protein REPUB_Repub02eG0205400 [Reevesia pubescens]
MDQYFLKLMLEQHSRAVLKNRYEILRSQYACIHCSLKKGFTGMKTQKMVIADDRVTVCNKYIKKDTKTNQCHVMMRCASYAALNLLLERKGLCDAISSENGTPVKDIGGINVNF